MTARSASAGGGGAAVIFPAPTPGFRALTPISCTVRSGGMEDNRISFCDLSCARGGFLGILGPGGLGRGWRWPLRSLFLALGLGGDLQEVRKKVVGATNAFAALTAPAEVGVGDWLFKVRCFVRDFGHVL